MKTNFSPKSSVQGNTLLVALMLCLILTISIAGYMKNACTQNFHSARSQAWNMSMTVTEAAVEEAMEHLNSNTGNLSQQGWGSAGVNKYKIKRDLTSTASYTVTIDMTSPNSPLITAKSTDVSPVLTLNSSGTTLAAAGANVSSTPNAVGRAVRVKAGRNGMFLKAMVAKHKIELNGNGVMTDSFDSSNTNYSNPGGLYPAGNLAKLLDNGDVASNDSMSNSVSVGNANIYGHVAVGPNGTATIGPNGGIGSHAFQAANGGSGIEDGYYTKDMNFTFSSVQLPYGAGGGASVTKGPYNVTNLNVTVSSSISTTSLYPSPVPAGGVQTNLSYTTASTLPNPVPYGTVTNTLTTQVKTSDYPAAGTYVGAVTESGNKWVYNKITGYNYIYPTYTYTYSLYTSTTNYTVSTYDYVLNGTSKDVDPAKFYINSLNGGTVYVRGNATLVIGGDFSMSGKDSLVLASDGKLEMYVGGTSCALGGNGVVNPSGLAANFICYCADSVTSMSFSGNGQFSGIIVAPNADLKLNGGGNNNNDFVGCVIANTITLNGHFNFHYDEALKNLKNSGRFIVKEWHEIPLELAGD